MTHRLTALLLLATACTSAPVGDGAAPFPGSGTVLFLGDSITWAGDYVADVEACWRAAHPATRTEFVQLGLSSETVSGLSEPGHAGGAFPRPVLSERLVRTLDALHPSLVIACYGMNDGIYRPFDEARFAAFRTGITDLASACSTRGVRLVVLTPPVFDAQPLGANVLPAGLAEYPKPFAGYDEVLATYARWLRTSGLEVADVHAALRTWIDERRRSESGFTCSPDGVHPDRQGHWQIARAILAHFGQGRAGAAASCEEALAAEHAPAELRRLVGERQRLLRDSWLTTIGHTRPGLPQGLPLDAARARARELDAAIVRTRTG